MKIKRNYSKQAVWKVFRRPVRLCKGWLNKLYIIPVQKTCCFIIPFDQMIAFGRQVFSTALAQDNLGRLAFSCFQRVGNRRVVYTFFYDVQLLFLLEWFLSSYPSLSRTKRVSRVYRHSWQCRIAAQTGLQAKAESVNNAVDFHNYAEQFRSLHTSFTRANNRAPHKFILLYSLCLLYESGSLHTEKNWFFGYAFGRMAGNIQAAMEAVGGKRIPPRKFRHAALPHEDRAILVFLCQTWYGGCIRTKKPHEGFIQPASICFGRRNRQAARTAAVAGRNAGGTAGCAVGTIVWNLMSRETSEI